MLEVELLLIKEIYKENSINNLIIYISLNQIKKFPSN